MSGNGERPENTVVSVRKFFEARHHVRRGICLINAGAYEGAALEFAAAARLNPESAPLGSYLVRCHMGRRDYEAAAAETARLVETDPQDITSRIRHAMLHWKRGDSGAAIVSLRESVAYAPDCAELHFQLGTLLAAGGAQEEAEMRFTQALALDGKHVEAMVSLAMCRAACGDAGRALTLLRRAQATQPDNARIGSLLSIALQAAPGDAAAVAAAAVMPAEGDAADDGAVIDELGRMIECDPELIDAFIDLPVSASDGELHDLLRSAVERLLDRHGNSAALHYRRGRLLERLGDTDAAVRSVERAVTLDSAYVPALIQLAKWYRKQGRRADAIARLEEVLARGACYADVHEMLGQLYGEAGDTDRARGCFREAIRINGDYTQAKDALGALSV